MGLTAFARPAHSVYSSWILQLGGTIVESYFTHFRDSMRHPRAIIARIAQPGLKLSHCRSSDVLSVRHLFALAAPRSQRRSVPVLLLRAYHLRLARFSGIQPSKLDGLRPSRYPGCSPRKVFCIHGLHQYATPFSRTTGLNLQSLSRAAPLGSEGARHAKPFA